MDSNWASEQLQTIRTLMERSAIYRRALAPIMIWNGLIGLIGGIIGWKLRIDSDCGFIYFWNSAAALGLIGSFLLVRRQALKDSEAFWSPPTRRIAQALLPSFFAACFITYFFSYLITNREVGDGAVFIVLWAFAYGCAIHSAGFFMTRGIKLFGWIFILVGCGLMAFLFSCHETDSETSPHLLMAAIFGGLHLIYGIYLYLTEKGKNAA